MDNLLEIIKICVPALLVLGAIRMMLNQFSEKEQIRLENERKGPVTETTLPIKLQAYERLVIFLERINPDNMLHRIQKPDMTARELQHALSATVRQEYQHNLAQQLYVSEESWKAVSYTKESINSLINSCFSKMPPEANSIQLAQIIIETYHSADTTPTEEAIKQLKSELVELLS